MSESIEGRASLVAERRGLVLGACLGFGKDGTVFSALPRAGDALAIKVLRRRDLFERERDCYRRLAEVGIGGVGDVCGHRVPLMLDEDPALMTISMTIVTAPYVLDFAGAYLDDPPTFPAEVMAERRAHWAEVFEERWPTVRRIMASLAGRGIFLLDPSPANIGFSDES